MQQYDRASTHYWYNPYKKEYYDKATEGALHFCSYAELRLYHTLLTYIHPSHISTQHKLTLNNFKWNIDFKLSGEPARRLHNVPFIRKLNGCDEDALYIEYKGLITQDLINKLSVYVPLIQKPPLLIVSPKSCVVELYHQFDGYPVISKGFFKQILSVLK